MWDNFLDCLELVEIDVQWRKETWRSAPVLLLPCCCTKVGSVQVLSSMLPRSESMHQAKWCKESQWSRRKTIKQEYQAVLRSCSLPLTPAACLLMYNNSKISRKWSSACFELILGHYVPILGTIVPNCSVRSNPDITSHVQPLGVSSNMPQNEVPDALNQILNILSQFGTLMFQSDQRGQIQE